MSGTGSRHRPLQSGVHIKSRVEQGSQTRFTNGTLAGLALRSGSKKVLVTSLHVMAGLTANKKLRNPTGSENMFQGGESMSQHKVGDLLDWQPVTSGPDELMEIDAAVCDLDDGITDPSDPDALDALYTLHDLPHGTRSVLAGTIEPSTDLPVIVHGARTQVTGHISDIEEEEQYAGPYFKKLIYIDLDADSVGGNSGAPLLTEVEPGVYKMVGIFMGTRGGSRRNGVACPASAVERILNVKFGHQKPVANAGNPQQAHVGDLVMLDGSGSDPDNRGDVTFRWKQVFSPPSLVLSEDPVDLSDETAMEPTFVPTKGGNLEFELTVTDVDGLSNSDTVTIQVNNPQSRTPAPTSRSGGARGCVSAVRWKTRTRGRR